MLMECYDIADKLLSWRKTDSIACDDCDKWTHRQCIGMSTTEFSKLGNSEETWTCLVSYGLVWLL
jgi:hypothetical protein